MSDTQKPALRWVGTVKANGTPHRYFAGVPARDLTAEEVEALDKDTRKALTDSGLYATTATKSSGGKTTKDDD